MASAKILELIHLLKEHDLGSIEVEIQDQLKIKIHAKHAQTSPPSQLSNQSEHIEKTNQAPHPLHETSHHTDSAHPVKAPLVGTVYLCPTPEEAPFVFPGKQVIEGETLCLIESMKTYNHITSPISGTVSQILIENATSCDFDQILFLVEPQE